MNDKFSPAQVQALLNLVQVAKDRRKVDRELAERNAARYELKTSYLMNGNPHDLTMDMSCKTDLGLWKEAERFLRDFLQEKTIGFVRAEILELGVVKFYSDDEFLTWSKS